MSYCDHCEGQRFDRARILRVLRRVHKDLGAPGGRCDANEALHVALEAVRALDIPHLELDDEVDEVVH